MAVRVHPGRLESCSAHGRSGVRELDQERRQVSGDAAAVRFTFMAAGIASLLLARSAWCCRTPPKKTGEPLAWLEAFKLLRHPFILVLFIVTFLDAAIHQFYFYWAATFLKSGVKLPANWVMPVMSIGQVAEIVTMAFLGLVLKKLGWRATMVIGILGHAGRFAVFAFSRSNCRRSFNNRPPSR